MLDRLPQEVKFRYTAVTAIKAMLEKIEELENGLKAQLAKLANDIRAAETSLITTKEGYLKVQGAMEILDILKKNLDEPADDEAVNIAL